MNKILIIDDDEVTLQCLGLYLHQQGLEVFTTADGPRGIEIFKQQRPDLVLLDLGLPTLDGIQVLKEIKRVDKNSKVIMISGYPSPDSIKNAFAAGAYAFMGKTFDLHDLRSTLDYAMSA